MESSKLTDEQLLELAIQNQDVEEEDTLDVGYYQSIHLIKDGNFKISTIHLYSHYKNWSIDPVDLAIFIDMLKLSYKKYDILKIDKEYCNIQLDKLIGKYVKEKRKKQKEERSRKVSSIKPKTKC